MGARGASFFYTTEEYPLIIKSMANKEAENFEHQFDKALVALGENEGEGENNFPDAILPVLGQLKIGIEQQKETYPLKFLTSTSKPKTEVKFVIIPNVDRLTGIPPDIDLPARQFMDIKGLLSRQDDGIIKVLRNRMGCAGPLQVPLGWLEELKNKLQEAFDLLVAEERMDYSMFATISNINQKSISTVSDTRGNFFLSFFTFELKQKKYF